jgi:hypothetical protein
MNAIALERQGPGIKRFAGHCLAQILRAHLERRRQKPEHRPGTERANGCDVASELRSFRARAIHTKTHEHDLGRVLPNSATKPALTEPLPRGATTATDVGQASASNAHRAKESRSELVRERVTHEQCVDRCRRTA